MGGARRGALELIVACVVGCGGTTQHSECPGPPNDPTKPPRWGTIPDYASALHETQLRIGLDGAAVVRRTLEDDPMTVDDETDLDTTDWMGSLNAILRFSSRYVTWYLGGSGGVSTLTVAGDQAQGSMLGGIGVRLNTAIGETHYRGLALRFDGSYGERVDSVRADTDPYTALRPLDEMRFGRDFHGQAILELRYELMGCYAPFVHVSGGLRWNRRADAVDGWTVPFSINVGAHREIGGDPYIVYGGLDLDVVEPLEVPEFGRRLRFGIETMNLVANARLNVFAEIVLGDVDGAYGGAAITIPFGGDAP